MAVLPLGLLVVAMLATGCDLLNKMAGNQKAAANPAPAMASGTPLSSDVPLTSDVAMSSDTTMTTDTAATANPADTAAPAANAPAAEAAANPNSDAAAGEAAVTSVGVFHERLSPYGQWVASESYGEVWVPRMGYGWRPYHTGHWAYTDQGWAWVAAESWGWATFHYGRWYRDPSYGWAWVPGTVWAPAWVAWRDGGGYLGWAALPPTVGFTVGVGLDMGGVEIEPAYWAFVPEGAILAPNLSVVIVAPERNVFFYRGSANITRYTEVNGRIVNAGIGVDRIERITGRPVLRTDVGRLGFYRPAAFAGAAFAAHAEFGHALHAQVAAERARGLVTGRPIAGRSYAGRPIAGRPMVGGVHTVHGGPSGSIASHRTTGSVHGSGVPSHSPTGHTGSPSAYSRSTHSTSSTTHSSQGTTTTHSTSFSTHSTGATVHSTGSTSHTTSSSTQSHQHSAPPQHQSPPPHSTGHKPPV